MQDINAYQELYPRNVKRPNYDHLFNDTIRSYEQLFSEVGTKRVGTSLLLCSILRIPYIVYVKVNLIL